MYIDVLNVHDRPVIKVYNVTRADNCPRGVFDIRYAVNREGSREESARETEKRRNTVPFPPLLPTPFSLPPSLV